MRSAARWNSGTDFTVYEHPSDITRSQIGGFLIIVNIFLSFLM